MALGAFEVTPLELARAYLPLANGGVRPRACIRRCARFATDDGQSGRRRRQAPVAVITPAEAYLMTSLLEGVIASGTGARRAVAGRRGEVAGKTGTTNDGRDAWFVGYSPRLLAAVWVGFDGGEPHGLSGAEAALPIWADFMKQALDAYPAPAFTVPRGHRVADVDTSPTASSPTGTARTVAPRDLPRRHRARAVRRARRHQVDGTCGDGSGTGSAGDSARRRLVASRWPAARHGVRERQAPPPEPPAPKPRPIPPPGPSTAGRGTGLASWYGGAPRAADGERRDL